MSTINQTSKSKIEELLGGTRTRVEIPSYQRTYSWTPEHAQDLYTDIVRFQSRHPGDKIDSAEYFLGSIVAVKSGKTLRLLDGQQRIATLTILLSSIRDAFIGRHDESADEIQKSLIQEREKPGTALRDRLQLNVYDRDYFHATIQEFPRKTDTPKKYASHKQIERVRKYFDLALSNDLESRSREEGVNWLLRLWVVVASCLIFVVVEAANEEDATEVFEVLNERGIGLSNIDLLRNFILGRAKDNDRAEIVESWKSVFSVSDNPTNVQQFLRHFWVSKHGDVKARGLYREIKNTLNASFDKMHDSPAKFSASLSAAADIYQSMLGNDTGSSELDAILDSISKVGANTLYPAILSSISHHGAGPTAPLAQALLTHYVRWTVIGRRESTELEKQVFKIAQHISTGLAPADAASRLYGLTVNDSEFREAFSNANLNKPGHRRHILEALETNLRKEQKKDEFKLGDPRDLHVEHVYPQSPKAGSKLEEHDEWVNRIGNLTLLGKTLNTKIRNGDFATIKKPEYQDSEILLNQWIALQESWNEDRITERQNNLASIALRTWPIPA